MKKKVLTYRTRRRRGRILFAVCLAAAAALVCAGTVHVLQARAYAQAQTAAEVSPSPRETPQPTFFIELIPATPAPSPTAPPTPSPTPNVLFVEGSEVTTVAWISDTQHYPSDNPGIFTAMTRFLRDEQARLNLKYIVHTGDFVDDFDSAAQWENAMDSMTRLAYIPYGVLAGNHDISVQAQDSSNYWQNLGEEAMKKRPNSESYYGGSYKNNLGHYDLLRIGSNRFIFVYMSYSPDSEAISWINSVFKKYSDRVGILCVHDYFKTDMTLSASGETLLKRVVKKNPNLYLVLCGHRYTVGMKPLDLDDDGDGENDRRVYQMINNYQAAGEMSGSGYMQFLQFDDAKREVRVFSYSPYTDDRRYHDTPGAELEKYPVDPKNEEYVFPYPWQ